jgi:hypothetical protein
MKAPAKPAVNFSLRLDLEADAIRHRLQQRTGRSFPSLVAEALKALENKLSRGEQKPAA